MTLHQQYSVTYANTQIKPQVAATFLDDAIVYVKLLPFKGQFPLHKLTELKEMLFSDPLDKFIQFFFT